jgi:exodeoxyribonuclease VII small subunit
LNRRLSIAVTCVMAVTALYWPAMARKNQTPPKTFEEGLAELEQILAEIEGGQVGLEESLIKYERGNFLIQHCRGVLNAAERQIEVLSKAPDGGIVANPMVNSIQGDDSFEQGGMKSEIRNPNSESNPNSE